MPVLEVEQYFSFFLRHAAATHHIVYPMDESNPFLFGITLDELVNRQVAFCHIAVRTGYHIVLKTRPASKRTGYYMVVCYSPRTQGNTTIDACTAGLFPQELEILQRSFFDLFVPDSAEWIESTQKKVPLIMGNEAFATGTVDPAPISQPFPERERAHISGNGSMPFLIPALLADDRPTVEADLPGMPYRNYLRHRPNTGVLPTLSARHATVS